MRFMAVSNAIYMSQSCLPDTQYVALNTTTSVTSVTTHLQSPLYII